MGYVCRYFGLSGYRADQFKADHLRVLSFQTAKGHEKLLTLHIEQVGRHAPRAVLRSNSTRGSFSDNYGQRIVNSLA